MKFTFDGIVSAKKEGGEVWLKFTSRNDVAAIRALGIADALSKAGRDGDCQVEGTIDPNTGDIVATGCSNVDCSGSCELQSSQNGNTVSYWCDCV